MKLLYTSWNNIISCLSTTYGNRLLQSITAAVMPLTSAPPPQDVKVDLLKQNWKISLWEASSVEPAMLRAPIVITLLILLWSCNIWYLDRSAIRLQYLNILSIKAQPFLFIFFTAICLIAGYLSCMSLSTNFLGVAVESSILLYYFLVLIILSIPSIPGYEYRTIFFRTIKLCFLPANTISFPEVLIADSLTSLSKVFKDLGITIIAIYAKLSGKDIVLMHDTGMILIAVLASLPFSIRVRQCLIQLDSASDFYSRLAITLNILKYLSSFPPIWIAAAASLGYGSSNVTMLAATSATINSIFGFLWDIVMDWGLISICRNGDGSFISFRQRFLLPTFLYIPASVINLILRFSWTANRVLSLKYLHASHLILLVEVAEVVRRALWNIFRIEWEIILKQDPIPKVNVSGKIDSNLLNVNK